MTTETSGTSFQALYKAAVDSAELSTVSRGAANAVIERLFKTDSNSAMADLTRQIQEAASKGDTDSIFRLTDKLKEAKERESERSGRILNLAHDFTFAEVLKAYPTDFNELVYEVGLLILRQVEDARKGARSNSGRKRAGATSAPAGAVYLITRGDRTIEAQKNQGAPRSPGAEREFFEFLGFTVSGDGKILSPASFKNSKGESVSAASKKHIIDDMLTGKSAWAEKGYTIKVKETPAE